MPIPLQGLTGVNVSSLPGSEDYDVAQVMLATLNDHWAVVNQQESPQSGDTITVTEQVRDVSLNVDPATDIASCVIVFPDTGRVGQKIVVSFTKNVETLDLQNLWSGHVNSAVMGEAFHFARQASNQILRTS